MSDGNNSNTGILIAVIGMVTTISGGVFSQWDKIFPPKEQQELVVTEPTAAGADDDQAATQDPAGEVALAVETPDDAASEPAR